MFADLNRYAVRPSRSLSVLYDHRDDTSRLSNLIVLKSPVFREVVEMERSTLSPRSRRLFTLSAIYTATAALVKGIPPAPIEDVQLIAVNFWDEVAAQFPEWKSVRDEKMAAGEVRRDFIHSHGIVLHALGRVGSVLLRDHQTHWKTMLKALRKIDWRRSNSKLWEGRAMIGGRISKAEQHVTLTTNLIKTRLKVPLGPEEQRVEDAFRRGEK
jgi:DNA sulfur modification protein DndB